MAINLLCVAIILLCFAVAVLSHLRNRVAIVLSFLLMIPIVASVALLIMLLFGGTIEL